MKSTEFNDLTLKMKEKYISQNGKYIGFREYYNSKVKLFSLNDFFVEVWYINEEKMEIDRIEPLQTDKTLDLYIDSMKKVEDEEKRKAERMKKHFAHL